MIGIPEDASWYIPPRHGLLELDRHFEQDQDVAEAGARSKRVRGTTVSGPQWARSDLLAELIEQLVFATGVYDVMTNPVVRYMKNGEEKATSVDLIVELYSLGDEEFHRYLVDVEPRYSRGPRDVPSAERATAARVMAKTIDAAYRMVGGREIRTPYLGNARRFDLLCNDGESDATLVAVRDAVTNKSMSYGEAVGMLQRRGLSVMEARHGVDRAVANRFVHCDLSQVVDEGTMLVPRGWAIATDHNSEPILKILHLAGG